MTKKIVGALFAASLMGGAALGGVALADEGHTPVVVCHWVPAHDGTFVVITVDDDGADGNKNLEAHAGHENDVINPTSGSCDEGTPD
jgi:hypothetical protein